MSAVSGSCQQPFISNSIRLKSLNFIYLRFRGFANWFIFNTMNIDTTVCYVFWCNVYACTHSVRVWYWHLYWEKKKKNWKRAKNIHTKQWDGNNDSQPSIDIVWVRKQLEKERLLWQNVCIEMKDLCFYYIFCKCHTRTLPHCLLLEFAMI